MVCTALAICDNRIVKENNKTSTYQGEKYDK